MRTDPEKLRAWKRRSKPPRRKKRINPVNKKRRKRNYQRNYGSRADFVRSMHCFTVPLHRIDERISCQGKIDAMHVIARGMGGAKGDRRLLLNGCRKHHIEAGEYGTSQRAAFEARWGVDLVEEAGKLADRLDAMGYD